MLEREIADGDHWPMLMPSHYARSSPLLDDLARELGVDRSQRPRSAHARAATSTSGIHKAFDYVRKSTARELADRGQPQHAARACARTSPTS